jgi:serine/threonine protein kinase
MSSVPDDDRTVIRPGASAGAVAVTSSSQPSAPAADHGSALPVGTRLGEFELTGMLGEGGFGIVYLAWDHSLERRVAVKEYMPSALAARSAGSSIQVKSERHRETFEAGRKSFVNEARLLAQFDHPSLVKVYRFWEANGTAYMVMPFYEGITLKDRLREMGGAPDEAWLMDLLAPLTEALSVIHAERCYHRDIAPDNVILLNGSNRPLLLDFGAARRVIGDMTQALTVILKPGYAPVEQYADAPGMKQGPWTDIYALAASVYFAILGKTPPPAVSRLMSDAYVPLVESAAGRYSQPFLATIDKALRVKPEDRTQSITELRSELGLGQVATRPEAARTSPPSDPLAGAVVQRAPAAPTGAAAGSETPAPRNRTTLIAVAAVGVLAVAGGALWWGLSGRSNEPITKGKQASPPTVAAAGPTVPAATTSAPPATAATPAPERPAIAPATAIRFDPLVEFDRVIAGQTGGFAVEARPGQPRLRIGRDKLTFSITSERGGHVTVFVLGPDGSLMRLFPNSETPSVQIKPGQTLRLPPGGIGIEASEPAGTEHFLAIVSDMPRNLDALGGSLEGGYLTLPSADALSARMAARAQSSVPFLLGSADACSQARCDDYGATRFVLEVTH